LLRFMKLSSRLTSRSGSPVPSSTPHCPGCSAGRRLTKADAVGLPSRCPCG
jgi:hypothetical protein